MQQLKEAVRGRMLASAAAVFAEDGYGGATMAAIAARAGVGTGNLYRYFAGKDELFYLVVTDELAERFLEILRQRVRSLIEADDLENLGDAARGHASELLAFWVEHRLQVITLLDRAAGSRFESFPERFVAELMRPSLIRLRRRAGVPRLKPVVRFTLEHVFRNTVRTIVAILEQHETEAAIGEAFAAFWSYQLAGLAGIERWVRS